MINLNLFKFSRSKSLLIKFFIILVFSVLICVSCQVHAQVRSLYADASMTTLIYFNLNNGQSITIETKNSSVGLDPAMHLMRKTSAGEFSQVSFNDNHSSSLESRIIYTNTSNENEHLVVLRSGSVSTQGESDIFFNGVLQYPQTPIGGNILSGASLVRNNTDIIHTVPIPGGSTHSVIFALNSYGSYGNFIRDYSLGGGAEGSVMDSGSDHDLYMIATPKVFNTLGVFEHRSGFARIIVNDSSNDSDGDGLGDDLENEIGTCALFCPGVYESKDTDGDSIWDSDELLGVIGPLLEPDFAMPRWGSNPMQKDSFVEIDYIQERMNDTWPFDRLDPVLQLNSNGSFDDWADSVVNPFLDGTASHLNNPNGQDGIRVHLGVTFNPSNQFDEHIYGNWNSGLNSIIPRNFIGIKESIANNIQLIVNNTSIMLTDLSDSSGNPKFNEFELAILLSIEINSVAGVDAFYASPTSPLNTHRGTSGLPTVVVDSDTPGTIYRVELIVDPVDESKFVQLTEELLDLGDRVVNSPGYGGLNYISSVMAPRVRYAMINAGGGGQAGGGTFFHTGISEHTFVHEFGHTHGISHWGSSKWGPRDVLCLPNYNSIMDEHPYKIMRANPGIDEIPISFHNTPTPGSFTTISPGAAIESNVGFNSLSLSNNPYFFMADTTRVDWNRSGIFAGSTSTWRAAINLGKNLRDCKTLSQGEQQISDLDEVTGAGDLFRYGDKLYAIYTDDSSDGLRIKYKFATLGSTSNFSCTGDADPNPEFGTNLPCLEWSNEYRLRDQSFSEINNARGVSAVEFDGYVFVAYRDQNNFVYVNRYTISSNILIWSKTKFFTSARTLYTPELAKIYRSGIPELVMVRLDEFSNQYRSYTYNPVTDDWSYDGAWEDENSNLIIGSTSPTVLSWPDVYNTQMSLSNKTNCALLPGSNGAIRMYCLDSSNGHSFDWKDVTSELFRNQIPCINDNGCTSYNFNHVCEQSLCVPTTNLKPELAYRPMRNGSGTYSGSNYPGHFMIFHRPIDFNSYRFLITNKTSTSSGQSPLSGGIEFNGNWEGPIRDSFVSNSPNGNISIYDDFTMGGAKGLWFPGSDNDAFILPFADGSSAMNFTIYSDFDIMDEALCERFAPLSGTPCKPRDDRQ